jgi:hypothetical protein
VGRADPAAARLAPLACGCAAGGSVGGAALPHGISKPEHGDSRERSRLPSGMGVVRAAK